MFSTYDDGAFFDYDNGVTAINHPKPDCVAANHSSFSS